MTVFRDPNVEVANPVDNLRTFTIFSKCRERSLSVDQNAIQEEQIMRKSFLGRAGHEINENCTHADRTSSLNL